MMGRSDSARPQRRPLIKAAGRRNRAIQDQDNRIAKELKKFDGGWKLGRLPTCDTDL